MENVVVATNVERKDGLEAVESAGGVEGEGDGEGEEWPVHSVSDYVTRTTQWLMEGDDTRRLHYARDSAIYEKRRAIRELNRAICGGRAPRACDGVTLVRYVYVGDVSFRLEAEPEARVDDPSGGALVNERARLMNELAEMILSHEGEKARAYQRIAEEERERERERKRAERVHARQQRALILDPNQMCDTYHPFA